MEKVETGKEVQDMIDGYFKNGSKLLQLAHYPSRGDEVSLDIEADILPYVDETIHLLSPHEHHERNLIYMYVEELIQWFPKWKEEQSVDIKLIAVVETLLLALDYLTHERFFHQKFSKEDREGIEAILMEFLQGEKTHRFSVDANRPSLNKSLIQQKDGKVFALDHRTEKSYIYMGVVYEKTNSQTDKMKQIGQWLGNIHLKPNAENISYEEYLSGMTSHEIHEDTLFHLNMVSRTLSWIFNSDSWRSGILRLYDEMDIQSKLGIRY